MSKAYGCGPPSYATSEEVSLTWGVKPCPRGMYCHGEPACGGPLPTPNNIDSIDWLSREDLKFILEVGKPYGNPEFCSGANCGGTPCCVSAFSDKGDGQNQPLLDLRKKLPHLKFIFRAQFVGQWDGGNWKHILVVSPGQATTRVLGNLLDQEETPVDIAA